MPEQFDEVGWIRGQVIVIELIFIGAVFSAAINSGLGLLMCALMLLPTTTAMLANSLEYMDSAA
jgi:hypothetical protein